MEDVIVIRPLALDDSAALAAMLQAQPPGYLRHFNPFRFDSDTISRILCAKVRDVYVGLFRGNRLVAFFMLRGWDEGYDVPAYGVVVDQAFGGQGLGRMTLDKAAEIARDNGATQIMLKVHPDNLVAKRLYERYGFVQTGIDRASAHLIYHKKLATKR